MPRPHRILFPLTLACAATVLPASAASLGGLSAGGMAAGQATVTSCDSAMSVSYATQGGDITSVTISGLADPTCEGGSLSVRALEASGASISSAGPATVAADADTADNALTLSLSPQPKADQVADTAISISGP